MSHYLIRKIFNGFRLGFTYLPPLAEILLLLFLNGLLNAIVAKNGSFVIQYQLINF